jgi:hypothetical protein
MEGELSKTLSGALKSSVEEVSSELLGGVGTDGNYLTFALARLKKLGGSKRSHRKKPKIRFVGWFLMFSVAIFIDIVQFLLGVFGVALTAAAGAGAILVAINEVADPFIGGIFVIWLELRRVSFFRLDRLGRLWSLLGTGVADELTAGIASLWVLDIWYIHNDVKKEIAEIEAQEKAEAEAKAEADDAERMGITPRYYDNGSGRPRGEQGQPDQQSKKGWMLGTAAGLATTAIGSAIGGSGPETGGGTPPVIAPPVIQPPVLNRGSAMNRNVNVHDTDVDTVRSSLWSGSGKKNSIPPVMKPPLIEPPVIEPPVIGPPVLNKGDVRNPNVNIDDNKDVDAVRSFLWSSPRKGDGVPPVIEPPVIEPPIINRGTSANPNPRGVNIDGIRQRQ